MNKILRISLIAGLLIAVMMIAGGCLATTPTTSATGEAAEVSWFDQYGMIIFLVVIFALFYFVMIRPQRKRQKQQQEMISSMQKGDKVVTAGGIFGVIDSVREDSVVIKVEGGTVLRVAKASVMVMKDQPPK
jgi:preprotein translocase subunit YajC